MTDAETIASLRASLAAAEAELLALTHRATTAEATVAALMADGAATLAALRDAAVFEREECAALVLAAAEEYATPLPGTDAHDLDRNSHAADVLRWVAEDIRARGSQEPPQRPEVPGDVATPAPVAPSPAGAPPVAASGVCPACRGRGRVLYAREVEDGCDECEATGRVAAEVGR